MKFRVFTVLLINCFAYFRIRIARSKETEFRNEIGVSWDLAAAR